MKNVLPRLQLSEPFLWFILYILDTQESVGIFTELGGIKVLCQSLIRSNKTLINMQPGMVYIKYLFQCLGKSKNVRNRVTI